MIDIGMMQHRVVLQKPGGLRDSVAERDTTWTNVATVYAAVEPVTGREQWIAAQMQQSTTHKVTLHYNPLYAMVDASWRVLFGKRVLVIDSVRNRDEANIELELICTEGLRDE